MPEAATAKSSTIRSVLAAAAASLERAGSATPRLDAELLLAEILGVSRARLVMDARAELAEPAVTAFSALAARRAAGEPVAYLLGRREFRHLTLSVDGRVLIPRPETEGLVEAALELPAGARVVDVGTGSGAVALALKHERVDLHVTGIDVSAGALEVACANTARLGLDVAFALGDLRDGLPGEFEAVLANLPYVESGAVLPRDVADYEPAVALFGGADGLDLVRALVDGLGETPFVALEVGEGQAAAVAALLGASGYGTVHRRPDLAGIERIVVGRRS